MQIGDSGSFWSSWTNIEWLIAGIIGAGSAVAGFVYRLSIKVSMLEHMVQLNDKDTNRRHEENLHIARGTQQRLDAISYRMDRWFGPSGKP